MSLDNIDMILDFEEEVEHVGENIFESRVSINMNPSLINIPDDFFLRTIIHDFGCL